MKKPLFAVLVLLTLFLLVYLAYVLPSRMLRGVLVTPNVTPSETQRLETEVVTPSVTPSVTPILFVIGDVYIRDEPNGTVIGSLKNGVIVYGICDGNWCDIQDGYVWRGCVSDNPKSLGCEAK